MRKGARHVIVGLSILTASMAVAATASADTYKSVANPAVCLGVKANSRTLGTNIVTWECNSNPDQFWTVASTSDYGFLYAHPTGVPDGSRCAALNNNGQGPQSIIWDCLPSSKDQHWKRVLDHYDNLLHPCYYFENEKFFGKVLTVASTSPPPNVATNVVVTDNYYLPNQFWCAYLP